MVFTIVMEQYGNLNNGTTATAMRLGKGLMELGHEVRVITCSDYQGNEGEKVYKLNTYHFPVFNSLIEKQGMLIAEVDEDVIKKAVEGSDLVHIILGLNLGRAVKKICRELNVPFTSAFHCQAENVSYSVGLGKVKFVNNIIYKYFRSFYEKDVWVHCPSKMIENELIKHKYECKTRVISNGITSFYHMERKVKPIEFKDKIVIVSSGRFSREKRQDLMIDAVTKSKYHKSIVLILCGKGPRYESLKKRSKKLENPVLFKFCSQEELLNIYNYADFYFHASDAEIEGLACMEAMACGLIPLISDSPKSATSQFALDDNCLFKQGSSSSLAKQLDYFIEHPEIISDLRIRYAEEMNNYRVDKSIKQMIEMFEDKIKDTKNDKD